MNYPERHHPVFFLQDALQRLGVEAVFNSRDERTLGCWGLIVRGKPLAWLIDVRWPHEREHEDPAAKALLEQGALVCCAQKPDAERLGAKWLPLAITPGFEPADKERIFDVAFVGYVRDDARANILTDVGRRYALSVAQGVFGPSAVDTYHTAKVGLNVPTRYGDANAYDSANMRLFEIAATGTPLVTAYEPYLDELGFSDGHTCYTYKSRDEVGAAIDKALHNPAVGQEAAQMSLARHTYERRAREVLRWLDAES